MVEIKMEGLQELQKRLLELPDKLGGNVLSSALGAAATVIQNEAKTRVVIAEKPYKLYTGQTASPGWLRDQIIKKRVKDSGNTAQTIITIKGKGANAFFWRFIEFGHFYVPKGSRNASRKWTKQTHAGEWVAARPFMRPAFAMAKEAALARFAEKMKERLDKEDNK